MMHDKMFEYRKVIEEMDVKHNSCYISFAKITNLTS